MRALIVGGGPAGLYSAFLLRRRFPDAQIRVVEQNPPNATFGFGVVFSDRALEFLREGDPETSDLIEPLMEHWSDLTIVHQGERITVDGIGFASIGRLQLLQALQRRLEATGVVPEYRTTQKTLPDASEYDLLIGADGVNSLVRQAFADQFKPNMSHLSNRFVWYGTTKPFDTLTQTFVRTPDGTFNAHHYRYASGMSTFLIECDPETWARAGFADLDETQTRVTCEAIFADTLGGHPLISNRSLWRQFPKVRTERWSAGKAVLIGDALRTAHFSIGSGTRLALEDAIALDQALGRQPDDIPAALQDFEAKRRPIVKKLVAAADASADWYERFPEHMAFEPWDLAWSYIHRSGRIDPERLESLSPAFVAGYRSSRKDRVARSIIDKVPDDTPEAREIGFALPETYNASSVLFANLDRGFGNRAALRGLAGTFTYRELCALASQTANALTGRGLERSERVLCLLDDTPVYPAVIFGAMRAGLCPVLVNTLSTAELVSYYARDSGARIAVIEKSVLATLGAQFLDGTRIELIIVANGDPAAGLTVPSIRFDDFIAGQALACDAADTSRNDMAFWMYSSGSTGRPKGVVHLHHDMAYTAASYARHILQLNSDDVCLSVPKIFFAYGFGNALTFPFTAGASSVLLPGRPDPASVFDAVRAYRPSFFFGLPTLYTALIKHEAAAKADFRSVRRCISAAEILANEVASAWQRQFQLDIIEGLGSTEVLHIYLSNSPKRKKPGSAGRRVPGYSLRLVDRSGRDVGDGEEGVLMVRGHSNAPAYWQQPDKTAETMRDGWIYTGDRFLRDADDFYYFRGRVDDLIKVSGQWVYPLEVELTLADHPQVRECAVLPLELADRRMTLKAFVVLADGAPPTAATASALQEFVKTRLLPYKYPRLIEFLPELPKTGTGKIDRQGLKQHLNKDIETGSDA